MISLGIILLLVIGSIHGQFYNNPPYPPRPAAYGWNVANLTNPGYPNQQTIVQYRPPANFTNPGYPNHQQTIVQYRPPAGANKGNTAISFSVGTKGYGDQLLLQTNVYKRPGIFRSTVTKNVEIRPNRTGFPRNITAIEVINHARDGSVPNVKITSGGIGKNYTVVQLKSEDRPINATVLFYGKPR